jgi:hypothetical protein
MRSMAAAGMRLVMRTVGIKRFRLSTDDQLGVRRMLSLSIMVVLTV